MLPVADPKETFEKRRLRHEKGGIYPAINTGHE